MEDTILEEREQMMLTRAELCQFIERGPAVKDNIEILGKLFYSLFHPLNSFLFLLSFQTSTSPSDRIWSPL